MLAVLAHCNLTSAPNHANFLAGARLEAEPLEHRVQPGAISDCQVLCLNDSLFWPPLGRPVSCGRGSNSWSGMAARPGKFN